MLELESPVYYTNLLKRNVSICELSKSSPLLCTTDKGSAYMSIYSLYGSSHNSVICIDEDFDWELHSEPSCKSLFIVASNQKPNIKQYSLLLSNKRNGMVMKIQTCFL